MSIYVEHPTLHATFQGSLDSRFSEDVVHFRGIPYGRIEKRFASPKAILQFDGDLVDATQYGYAHTYRKREFTFVH